MNNKQSNLISITLTVLLSIIGIIFLLSLLGTTSAL